MVRYRVIYMNRGLRYIQSDNLKYRWIAKMVAAYWNCQYKLKPYEVEEYNAED